jgi:hypothetical protein
MYFRRSRALRLLAVALLHLASPFTLPASAQRPPTQPNAAEILHRMQKLNVLGSVLYIAAHPDDENTRLIAWLANGKKVRTGYLSLTRGEGGQNLIGPELGDALGIIRTQELLENSSSPVPWTSVSQRTPPRVLRSGASRKCSAMWCV